MLPDTTSKNPESGEVASGSLGEFPCNSFPPAAGDIVLAIAEAKKVCPSMVSLAVLAVAAGAIGTTRRFFIQEGWLEPSIIWAAVVMESGGGKSPMLDEVDRPIRQLEETGFNEYYQRLTEYQDECKASKRKHDAPPPIAKRYIVDDCTTEALAVRLNENPRGLLLINDELTQWFKGFDSYKSGSGVDAPRYLKMWGGKSFSVDRKNKDSPVLYCRNPGLSILGGIQPQVLKNALGRDHFINGLAARLLMVRPEKQLRTLSDGVPRKTREAYAKIINRLYDLSPELDSEGNDKPILLEMSVDAGEVWREFYDRHAHREFEASGDEAALLAKTRSYVARISLVVELLSQAADGYWREYVSRESMLAGVTLAEWFADEGLRIYSTMRSTSEDEAAAKDRRSLIAWIGARPRRETNSRDLQRHMSHRFSNADSAALALRRLMNDGIVTSRFEKNPEGGPPVDIFQLASENGDQHKELPDTT